MHELHEAQAAYVVDRTMTEEEFVEWCDEDVKAEYIDGKVVIMAAASARHVRIARQLLQVVGLFVDRNELGEVLGTEFQVRLRPNLRRVPDLIFVRRDNLDLVLANHLEGPPDAVFEVVSPDSTVRDRQEKYHDYQTAGIPEYILIDPLADRILHYVLIDGKYVRVPSPKGRFQSRAIPGFWFREDWFLQDPLPDPIAILKELGTL